MSILSKIRGVKPKDRFLVGIDIGNQYTKMVKLKLSKEAAEICDFDLLASALDPVELLKKLRVAHDLDLVNISFSGPASVVRYVNLLRMNISELRQALKYEAQKHIPFNLAEVNLDASILKDDLPDNKMLVLLAALKKEAVTQRVKSMEAAGLKVNSVGLDSISLINAFNYNYPKLEIGERKAVCLVNIGADLSNVSIIDNGIPRLSRDIHIGGNAFTKKAMDAFSLDSKPAEGLKVKPDAENLEKIKLSIEPVLSNLAAEIRTSFDYYESQNTSTVAKIFLSGGGSLLAGLKESLANSLGLEVEFWDAFKRIVLGDKIDKEKLKDCTYELNVAAGLALY